MFTQKRPAPPDDDPRWKLVDATMRRYGYNPDAVIETLHTAQDAFGCLSSATLEYISESLNVPPSKIFGVATFYNYFNLTPPGEHVISICTGTACYVKGAGEILDWLKEEYGLEPGQTTPDRKLSLKSARCVGACGLAPVVILDGDVVGNVSMDAMKKRVREWIGNDK